MYADVIAPHLPAVTDRCVRAVRCLYTVTPDADFIVDEHPDLPGVLLVSPCSGHGFKHSAELGEAIAQRITSGASHADLSPFRIDRFAVTRATG